MRAHKQTLPDPVPCSGRTRRCRRRPPARDSSAAAARRCPPGPDARRMASSTAQRCRRALGAPPRARAAAAAPCYGTGSGGRATGARYGAIHATPLAVARRHLRAGAALLRRQRLTCRLPQGVESVVGPHVVDALLASSVSAKPMPASGCAACSNACIACIACNTCAQAAHRASCLSECAVCCPAAPTDTHARAGAGVRLACRAGPCPPPPPSPTAPVCAPGGRSALPCPLGHGYPKPRPKAGRLTVCVAHTLCGSNCNDEVRKPLLLASCN